MSYKKSIEKYINALTKALKKLDKTQIERFVKVLSKARSENRNIFVFGNGGSGSTAAHMACDFNKGCSYGKRKRFKVICLNDNMPTVSAYANDVSYNDIFIEQLKNFIRPGDVVIGISGSGNSENVVRAIDYANKNGALTVGLCGFAGGLLKKKAKIVVHINVNDMQKVEDLHYVLSHIAMQILSEQK